MRKDVECTFGILKGQFRILKTGIRLHGVNNADNIWLTCCALHNMLLDIDGLLVEWEGEIGLFDANEHIENLPYALNRLNTGSNYRQYDSSGMGPGVIADDYDINNATDDQSGEIVNCDNLVQEDINVSQVIENEVRKLNCNQMREKLIVHFNILFQQNKVRWPSKY